MVGRTPDFCFIRTEYPNAIRTPDSNVIRTPDPNDIRTLDPNDIRTGYPNVGRIALPGIYGSQRDSRIILTCLALRLRLFLKLKVENHCRELRSYNSSWSSSDTYVFIASNISEIQINSSAEWERDDSPGPSFNDGKGIRA